MLIPLKEWFFFFFYLFINRYEPIKWQQLTGWEFKCNVIMVNNQKGFFFQHLN